MDSPYRRLLPGQDQPAEQGEGLREAEQFRPGLCAYLICCDSALQSVFLSGKKHWPHEYAQLKSLAIDQVGAIHGAFLCHNLGVTREQVPAAKLTLGLD